MSVEHVQRGSRESAANAGLCNGFAADLRLLVCLTTSVHLIPSPHLKSQSPGRPQPALGQRSLECRSDGFRTGRRDH